jgi:hypothetical protein
MDELQRVAGMTRSCEELCDPGPCFKQLSPTLFVLQENMGVLFICKFTMVWLFNDNYKVMTILILFMLVFKMFVVGVFCNCHNI